MRLESQREVLFWCVCVCVCAARPSIGPCIWTELLGDARVRARRMRACVLTLCSRRMPPASALPCPERSRSYEWPPSCSPSSSYAPALRPPCADPLSSCVYLFARMAMLRRTHHTPVEDAVFALLEYPGIGLDMMSTTWRSRRKASRRRGESADAP
jgi:hypothetical protein